MTKLFLTPAEVTAATGLSRNAVYRLIRDGTWRVVRAGRAIRIPMAEIERWAGVTATPTPHDRTTDSTQDVADEILAELETALRVALIRVERLKKGQR